MEKKKFNEYSAEDKEALLMHWWYYYGKLLVNLEEFETFHDYVLRDSEAIKDAAVLAYIAGESSQAMIGAMRAGKMDEFLAEIKKLKANNQYVYDCAEKAFIDEIVGTYNKPEANVPMDESEICAQLTEMIGVPIDVEADAILTAKRVEDTYKACSLKKEEVSKSAEPLVPFIIGEGINNATVFNAERLEEKRTAISEMIGELPKIDEGVSFLVLCEDKNGRQWTDLHSTMELLLQLGNATGELQFLVPREMWSVLPGGMPYVVRNKEAAKKDLTEYKPAEFKKVKANYANKHSKNGKTTQ